MKSHYRIFVVTVLAVAALACVALSGCTVSASSAYTFDGGKAEISGKTLTVTLDANATTGYEWTADVSGSALEMTEQNYVQNVSVGAQTGTSGSSEFVFEGKSAGDTTITLKYARSWETTDADKTVVVNVTTDSNGKITKTETTVDGVKGGESKA